MLMERLCWTWARGQESSLDINTYAKTVKARVKSAKIHKNSSQSAKSESVLSLKLWLWVCSCSYVHRCGVDVCTCVHTCVELEVFFRGQPSGTPYVFLKISSYWSRICWVNYGCLLLNGLNPNYPGHTSDSCANIPVFCNIGLRTWTQDGVLTNQSL